jgi:ABC-2 type transport system permease protein
MNMYLYELKSQRKSTINWTLVMIALAAMYLAIYPGIANDANDFKDLLSNYPPAVRAILGINIETITSLLGFYSMIFSFIILAGAIQAMNLGVLILSKEARERTADFLLVKPVSRSAIVTAKLFAAITSIIVTNITFCVITPIIANLVKIDDFNLKVFTMINLTLLFIQIIFIAIGMIVSVFFQKIKSILPISLGFVFGFYFIGAFLATGSEAEVKRVFSPFKYFDITYIINNESYETLYLVLSAVIVIISIIATYFIYNKKDIHAVS